MQRFIPLNINALIISLFIFLTGYFIFELSSLKVKRWTSFSGVAFFLIFIIIGQIIFHYKNITHDPRFYRPELHDEVIVKINEPLENKPNTYKAEVSLCAVVNRKNKRNKIGKSIAYFTKTAKSLALKYGDEIIIRKKLEPISNLGNPGEFDYKKYLSDRQIYYRVLLSDDDWQIKKINNEHSITALLFEIRYNILNMLRQNFTSNNQSSIAEALLIGYTGDLDKSTQQAYSNIGVIHIIAISGMHLGFIYLLISFCFNNLPILKRSKVITAILIVSILWAFALLTGANSSILRSAIMFSIMILSKLNGRRNNTYNALFVSAFLLLCYNPYLLWDLGFQLSYISIISILIFHKRIFAALSFQNKILKGVWEMMSLTLSAQILTFPICLFYFHQFPNTFLISNLLLIPLSTIALFAEIMMMLFYKLIYIGPLIIKITSFLIILMNNITNWFNNIPNGTTTNIVATLASTFFLYLLILLIWNAYCTKSKKTYLLSVGSLITFVIITSVIKYNNSRQNRLIVYNIPKSTAIEIIRGNNFDLIGQSNLNASAINYTIKPAHAHFYANRCDSTIAVIKEEFFITGNHLGMILNKESRPPSLKHKMNLDVIILTAQSNAHLAEIAQQFQCANYIIDSSNPLWKIDKWKKECEGLHLPFYVTSEQGAYIMNL